MIVSAVQMAGAQPGCGFGPGRGCGEGRGFGPGSGFGDGPGYGPGHGEGILERAEELELTPEQVDKIKAMHLNMAKETIEVRNQLELKQLELRELLSADRPDIRKIEAKIDEMVPLRTMLQKKHIGQRLAVCEVLTSEQREKLDAMRGPRMRHERGDRRGWDDEGEDDDRGSHRR